MKTLNLYSKQGCPFCSLLKAELVKRKVPFNLHDLSDDKTRAEFYANSGTTSVPQLFLSDVDESCITLPKGVRLGGWSEVSLDWAVLDPVHPRS